jgi:glutamate-1-semialdehyde 2,1-aminomutase
MATVKQSSIQSINAVENALESARKRYLLLHPKSREAFEESKKYMPGGNTRTVLFHTPFPLRIQSGSVNRVTDADGNQYINFLGEYTAGLFGHSNPVIRKAIDAALDRGLNLSGHNPDEITLAKLVCERFPSIENVRFTNSGTEANLLAISAARHHTSRNKVMVFEGGYHGGLLYFGGGGIPINAPFDYVIAPYNDIANTEKLIVRYGDELACVLVEPMQGSAGCIPGNHEFLAMLSEYCKESDIVLIFDEVMTSRLSSAGAQGKTGIIPDMTTLGKYIGGGMSFGAFGGRREIMEMFDPTLPGSIPHAGTFNNNSLTMAAGVAAMRDVITDQNLTTLNSLGDHLRDGLNKAFDSANARLTATGSGSIIGIHPVFGAVNSTADLVEKDDRLLELLFLLLLERGYYIARRGFIALMLDIGEDEINGFLAAVQEILDEYQSVFKV